MRPSWGVVLIAALIGAIVGAAGATWAKNQSIRKFEAQVAEKDAALDSLKAKITGDSIVIVEQEEKLAEVRDSALRAVEKHEVAAVEAEQEADSLYNQLVAQSAPELTPVFQAWRDSWMTAITEEREAKLQERRLRIETESTLDLYRKANADLHDALRRSEELSEFWKEKSKRNWWERPMFTVPATIGATILTVEVVKSITD
jgi:hypothetical protein